MLLILLLCLSSLTSAAAKSDKDLYDSCNDEDTACAKYAKSGRCIGDFNADKLSVTYEDDGAYVNSRCKQSCMKYYREERQSIGKGGDAFIRAISGANRNHMDIFGIRHQVCDVRDGWTSAARMNLFLSALHSSSTMFVFGKHKFTTTGFKVQSLPKKVREKIDEHYQASIFSPDEDLVEGLDVWNPIKVEKDRSFVQKPAPTILVSHLQDSARQSIGELLRPLAEKFCRGVDLEVVSVSGIKRYMKGGKMMGRTERSSTHVISALVHLGHDGVDAASWPLQIIDHDSNLSEILLKKGEVLWYEGGRLPIGRVKQFEAHFYDDLVVHFNTIKADKSKKDDSKKNKSK